MRTKAGARSIMLLGTASNVGKSTLCTALCRILAQDGYRVAPFKAQNMSLNSAVTPSGREIGRAQAVQAEAAGILPSEHMNPVLLKPTGVTRSQVIVQGKVKDTVSARTYFQSNKEELWTAVTESFQFLQERYEVIVMEGAGSPVEMNLKARDIVNMRAAMMADADVLLVADIDRGGVFASVVGTLHLLTAQERARVKGVIINKFRGDPALFEEGVHLLEEYAKVPVLGVIPHISDLGIEEEDSLGLESERYRMPREFSLEASSEQVLQIAVIAFPHLANFTDFDPLFLEPDVVVNFCDHPNDLQHVDAIILPGTKNTMEDLRWLKESGLASAIRERVQKGTYVLGICGGFQMLGQQVRDPHHHESSQNAIAGLELFDCDTVISDEKRTELVVGELQGPYAGIAVTGYEIHMGKTSMRSQQIFAFAHSERENLLSADGAQSADGSQIGTYLHGILHNDDFRTVWLNRLRVRRGWTAKEQTVVTRDVRKAAYDRLAEIVRQHLNMEAIYQMLSSKRL
ncbi:cobyric acid synthase [Sulfoacidibacillus thermotolerans]|uniref:Cobyric acid synthase n=1 Tax=Sulfoacidibacillus thermotolerans TaxID=1765684 RepID=A0A2U3DBR9_SULT2|nr:cobyric acid synthase [Sulfoacidibacillus thermotolerans]PWI58727.1 cobyric acid synthase CobQ [Sulfoacidibacillus thermotolerans]